MSLAELSAADFKSSVVAVPPIALTKDWAVNPDTNATLVRHIEAGGVSILLYGGNANLYNYDLGRYRDALDMMVATGGPGTRIITSIGPDYGKIVDQLPLVERSGIRNVMMLPVGFPSDSHGVMVGARKTAERLGFGVILYLKRDMYVKPETLEKLVNEGAVRFVKYAVERSEPATDAYLDAILGAIGNDLVASGMGETPVHDHIGNRGMATFTSGAVCIAPRAAMSILAAYRQGNRKEAEAISQPFLEFEKVRARYGGIQVLHDAVGMAGIADMGPMLPMLSNTKSAAREDIALAVDALLAGENATAA